MYSHCSFAKKIDLKSKSLLILITGGFNKTSLLQVCCNGWIALAVISQNEQSDAGLEVIDIFILT